MIVNFPDLPSGEELFDLLICYIDSPPAVRNIVRYILDVFGGADD
jgi:hypothetical protein